MKFGKYNDMSNVPPVVQSNNSVSSDNSMNRILWGNQDTGDTLMDTIHVKGSLYLDLANFEDEDTRSDDESDDEIEYETEEDDQGASIYMRKGTLYSRRVNYKYPLMTLEEEKELEKIDYDNETVPTCDLSDHQYEQDFRLSYLESLFPIGTILMWSTSAGKIPDGWEIATELQDKFIRGGATAGNTGGKKSVTLTVDNMPSHNHSATTNVNLTINNSSGDVPVGYRSKLIPAIDKIEEEYYDTGGSSNAIMYTGNKKGDYGLVGIKVTDLVSYAGGATGSATATTTIGNTGGGKSFDIIPEYYSVIFIKKVREPNYKSLFGTDIVYGKRSKN